jgi:hypothetical protein
MESGTTPPRAESQMKAFQMRNELRVGARHVNQKTPDGLQAFVWYMSRGTGFVEALSFLDVLHLSGDPRHTILCLDPSFVGNSFLHHLAIGLDNGTRPFGWGLFAFEQRLAFQARSSILRSGCWLPKLQKGSWQWSGCRRYRCGGQRPSEKTKILLLACRRGCPAGYPE